MSFRLQDSKTRGGAVRFPARIEAIIYRVRTLAEQTGLDPAMIESVYQHLIEQSIEGESRY
jgi:chorismate mutase